MAGKDPLRRRIEVVNTGSKGEIAALRSKISKLKELYLNDFITLDEYRADQLSYTEKVDALLAEEAKREPPDFQRAGELLSSGWEALYETLNREQKQEL